MGDDLLMGAVYDDTESRQDQGMNQVENGGEDFFGETGVVREGETFVPDEAVGYGDFSLPEGMVADEGMATDFRGLAKELNLPRGGAQKLVDFYAEAQAKQAREYHQQIQQWKDQVMSDAEMGGHRWSESQRYIAKARDFLGGEEFVDFVESTGIGNHPALLRFCLRAGKLLTEDSAAEGSSRTFGAGRSAADVLFGDLGIKG